MDTHNFALRILAAQVRDDSGIIGNCQTVKDSDKWEQEIEKERMRGKKKSKDGSREKDDRECQNARRSKNTGDGSRDKSLGKSYPHTDIGKKITDLGLSILEFFNEKHLKELCEESKSEREKKDDNKDDAKMGKMERTDNVADARKNAYLRVDGRVERFLKDEQDKNNVKEGKQCCKPERGCKTEPAHEKRIGKFPTDIGTDDKSKPKRHTHKAEITCL